MKISVVFLLLLIFVLGSQEMVKPSYGRDCESRSLHFKGMCMSTHNCGIVCQQEGFSAGHCRGLRRRCFCSKPC
ncbi:Defensin-like protein 1 [Euphorbia peplus]|nr:Defensin-like protein 1 [Euphorbia peplus]